MLRQFVIKLNRACNLECNYCYYINSDTKNYGSRMPLNVLLEFLEMYDVYCSDRDIQGSIVLHGGEPLLMGSKYIRSILTHSSISSGRLFPILQTNGTLINQAWVELFQEFKLEVGVSLDGPEHIHNKRRQSKNGQNSYVETVRGIKLLQQYGVNFGVLAVVDSEENGAEVFEHLVSLGISHMDFLMPMHTQMEEPFSNISTGIRRYLMNAFEAWYKMNDPEISVRLFMTLMKKHLHLHGGYFPTGVDRWDEFAVLETDGTIGRLEELSHVDRIAGTDFYNSHLSFTDHNFSEIEAEMTSFWNQFSNINLPSECEACEVNTLCRGGNFGTRYAKQGAFNNRSAHCKSLKALSQSVVWLYRQHKRVSEANQGAPAA